MAATVVRSGRRSAVAYLLVVAGLIALLVWSANRPDWEPVAVEEVAGSETSAELSVTVRHMACPDGPRVEVVEETAAVVTLRAEQNEAGDCDATGLTTTFDVELARPLGDRAIVGLSGVAACVVDGDPTDRCYRTSDG
ncbi:MAG: hypothetical protein S0880_21660 [Actinomycetota bacterium]|nr:hypothetical protein [Actinomycetota bacterium]